MATEKKPVLDLDVFEERTTVKIGGKSFELRNLEEFAPIDMHRIAKKGRRLDALMKKADAGDELTDAEELELEQLPLELSQKVIASGDPTTLDDAQRWRLCQSFTTALEAKTLTKPAPAAKAPVRRSTGEK